MSFRQLGLPEITHVLLIETNDGLILIDSGLGLEDFKQPSWVEWLAMRLSGVTATPDETPLRQLIRLGYEPQDVRHIVPTHQHFDHIGGALDFPKATVHAWEVDRGRAGTKRLEGVSRLFTRMLVGSS